MISDKIITDFKKLIPHYDGYMFDDLRILNEASECEEFRNSPNQVFDFDKTNLLIVNSRSKCYGDTDQCNEWGCWRILARDKLMKCRETRKFLGFKRILKFCDKDDDREYREFWVMEEFRLKSNQDIAMCKIKLLRGPEISALLYKHFSRNYYISFEQQKKDIGYLDMLTDFYENKKFDGDVYKVSPDVYKVFPGTILDTKNVNSLSDGSLIFADGEDIHFKRYNLWMVLEQNRPIKSEGGQIVGTKRVLQFFEKESMEIVGKSGTITEGTWILEEYKLAGQERQSHALCILKLLEPYQLTDLLKMSLGEE